MQETRGRPRNEAFDQIAKDVAKWHEAATYFPDGTSKFVSIGPMKDINKAANAFRNSMAYHELREVYGDLFAIRTDKKTCCFLVGHIKEGK